ILILNLRDYPTWTITRNATPVINRPQREDGLIAIPIPAGPSDITITPTLTRDQIFAYLITAITVLLLILIHRHKPISGEP
ncbi:MAG TPA: hypothetical protein VIX42_05025, partial [Edaphobacter sp.]